MHLEQPNLGGHIKEQRITLVASLADTTATHVHVYFNSHMQRDKFHEDMFKHVLQEGLRC